MRQLSAHNTPARPLSTAGTWGKIQIAPSHETIVLDVKARHYDASGDLHRDRALAHLALAAAIRVRDQLSEAILVVAAADPRHLGSWSDAALQGTAARRRVAA